MKYISSTIISLFMGSLMISGLLSCGGSGGNGGNGGSGPAVTGSTVETVASSNVAGEVATQVGFTALGTARNITVTPSLSIASGDGIDNVTCSFSGDSSASSFQVSCICGEGGSITVNFDGEITEGTCNGGAGETISVDMTGTSTYSDCVVTECGEAVTLNGSDSFTIEGQMSQCTNLFLFSETVQTAQSCSGMTATTSAGTNTIGYNITVTWSLTPGDIFSVLGQFCIDDQNVSFNSKTEFEQFLDPDSLCDSSQ